MKAVASGLIVGIGGGLAYTYGAPFYAVLLVLVACCLCITMMERA